MYIIFAIAVLPAAMSQCWKQNMMKSFDMDLMWTYLWSGNFEVLWGFVLYTVNWIPYPVPGGYNTQSPSTLGKDLRDAWTCFTGTDPIPEINSCSADQAWLWFLVYLMFNVSYVVFMLWLTKYLSATWASIGSVLCGDLYGVLGQFGFISGGGRTQWMPLEQWLALSLSSVAMWVYNIEDEVGIDGQSVYGVTLEEKESQSAALENLPEPVQV
jgi:hypothetical protein